MQQGHCVSSQWQDEDGISCNVEADSVNFLGIGPGELLLILILAFIIFGPRRLPELGRTLGKTMQEIRNASQELTSQFREELGEVSEELEAASNELLAASEELRQAPDKLGKPEKGTEQAEG